MEDRMPDSAYTVIELVGTSTTSWEDAAKNAVETAAKSLRDLRTRQPRPDTALDHRRLGCADVAVAQVRRLSHRELVFALELGQPILGIGRHRRVVGRLEVDAIEASRVGAENHLL